MTFAFPTINSDTPDPNFQDIIFETPKARRYATIFYQYMKEKANLRVTPNITKILNNAFISASSQKENDDDHMSMLCEAVFFIKLLTYEILPTMNSDPESQEFNDLQRLEILENFLK